VTDTDRLAAIRAARADLTRKYLAATNDDDRDFVWREIRAMDRHEDRLRAVMDIQKQSVAPTPDPLREAALAVVDCLLPSGFLGEGSIDRWTAAIAALRAALASKETGR
jgi:hypothetical protein